jgi:hypothetical protein
VRLGGGGKRERVETGGFVVTRAILKGAASRQCPSDMNSARHHAEKKRVIQPKRNSAMFAQRSLRLDEEGPELRCLDGYEKSR